MNKTLKKPFITYKYMEEDIFTQLILKSNERQKESRIYTNQRYLYSQLENKKSKYFIGIYGLRGIGKTILLLQLANNYKDGLYFSADAQYLKKYTLYEIINFAIKKNYKNIFVDEITSKPEWKQDLKTTYDENINKKINITFTSSSSINLIKGADLSRRVILYNLKIASFREYLNIKKNQKIDSINLKEILSEETRKSLCLSLGKYEKHLNEYYRYGGLLYNEPENTDYYKSLENIIKKIIYNDLSHLRNINVKIENDIYNILFLISTSQPFELNYTRLAKNIGMNKNTLISLVTDIEKTGLIKLLRNCSEGYKFIRSEPKIFLNIPFRFLLNYTINKDTKLGSIREDFFVSATEPDCSIKVNKNIKTPDFKKGKYTFEVGSKNKKNKQKADYLVLDALLFEENKIPLFLFGFLY